jgi:hypothetical protein
LGCAPFNDLTLAPKKQKVEAGACQHAKPLPLPMNPTGGIRDYEFVVAFHKYLFLGPDGGTQDFGFDLDGMCTGEGEGPSCLEPSWAGQHPDGRDGRDNSALASYVALDDAGTPRNQAITTQTAAESGALNTLIRVRHFNGAAADNDVEVAFFAGTTSPDALTQAPIVPAWGGNDVWRPLAEWIVPNGDAGGGQKWTAKYVSSKAYVTGGVLVAHLDYARGATAFRFSDVWIQARIEGLTLGPGHWSLRDGVFGGRALIDDVLANVEYAADPTGGNFTCRNSPNYLRAKQRYCAIADIRYEGNDPTAPCDAVSWQWRFDADPAKLADDFDRAVAADLPGCPRNLKPSGDTCASLDGDGQ